MAYHDIEEEILELKDKHNALILAHFYEDGDIQDIADHVGDSLFLAQMGQKAENPVILLAGVIFMAESVKILSPKKTVLAPDMNAGCSLVDSSPIDKYRAWREENPEAISVTYVNCSSEVKAISDVICTSSNVEKIVNAIPKDREILFGPDKQLGKHIAGLTGREMKLWDGSCEVHMIFSGKKLYQLKKQHPDAVVVAHPECADSVLQYADVIGSTSKLLSEVKTNTAVKTFIIATESGIMHKMQQERPDATLIQAPADNCACNDCPYMKLNTLEKVRDALKFQQPQIELSADLIERAQGSLKRMMDITEGRPVSWPDRFSAPKSPDALH
ncbi:quinolinate synthase [Candidatus Kaiserbacteria bacterium]|nr:MAG: quinolinate synthase [Candidatus Kaiserbacteria bacterium]